MKKIFTLMLAIPFMVAMYSCSSDDKDDSSIVGKWEAVKQYGEVTVTPADMEADLLEEMADTFGDDYSVVIEFHKGGTGTTTSTDIYNNGEEEIKDVVNSDFKYSTSGNKLTVISKKENDNGDEVERTVTVDFAIIDGMLLIKSDELDEYEDYFERNDEEGVVTKAIVVTTYKRK